MGFWVFVAQVAQLIFLSEDTASCALNSGHGGLSRKPSIHPERQADLDFARKRWMKGMKQRASILQNLRLVTLGIYEEAEKPEALQKDPKTLQSRIQQVHSTIEAWNSNVHGNLRRQFAEGRGRVVLMSYDIMGQDAFDAEHFNAAGVWTELGIDVLFYRNQISEVDLGNAIRDISDLALQRNAQADVLLEDHFMFMKMAFSQPHFLDVMRNVSETSFRLSVLTCSGAHCSVDLYSTLRTRISAPDSKIPIYPSDGSIGVCDGPEGKGIYDNAAKKRARFLEKQVNGFFDFEAFKAEEEVKEVRGLEFLQKFMKPAVKFPCLD